jgi:hypothetical protein
MFRKETLLVSLIMKISQSYHPQVANLVVSLPTHQTTLNYFPSPPHTSQPKESLIAVQTIHSPAAYHVPNGTKRAASVSLLLRPLSTVFKFVVGISNKFFFIVVRKVETMYLYLVGSLVFFRLTGLFYKPLPLLEIEPKSPSPLSFTIPSSSNQLCISYTEMIQLFAWLVA